MLEFSTTVLIVAETTDIGKRLSTAGCPMPGAQWASGRITLVRSTDSLRVS